jgi:NAD(P)-dependent dehydrogenase (short-subunit alcohol dehydrogenase family)
MNISFESKVALVTGAGSGLGLATARAFAESGASVVLADWNEKDAISGAKDLANKGHKTLAIRCDVSDDAQVEAMVEQTVATFGRLDAAYNNAGVQNVLAETADTTREDYERVMGVNLRGVWSCMKFELQQMRKQGSEPSSTAHRLGDLWEVPSVASTMLPSTESLGSPRALLSNMRHAAFALMLYVRVSFGHRWPTRWSPRVKVKPSRQWKRASRWHGLAARRRLPMLFCAFAAMPQAT